VKVVYHAAVQTDVNAALRYYDGISPKLGDEFWEELTSAIAAAAAAPTRHHFVAPDRRRANLKRFPYHFLYREIQAGIRILAVRHNKQHPSRSLGRK
jgi:plasmid stabilization system protein ParE